MNTYRKLESLQCKIAVIGLGYVGLPLAVSLSEHFKVIGFDKNEKKIMLYQSGIDLTDDVGNDRLSQTNIEFTSDETKLIEAQFFIIAVPTPVRNGNVPDLIYIEQASELVGRYLKQGDTVVYESTVYPGVTEEICLPILERSSNLKAGKDFKLGYSPERVNPGDKIHILSNIVKIVSGIDEETVELLADVYGVIVKAGIHRAPSIRVAEAAKVVENAQRDVNIAFMNELAILFSTMNINTKDVLEAAATKWNFLNFTPGLVGGHCIGIDPYYLTYKAEDLGIPSKLILSSRHINDSMGKFVANQMIKKILKTTNNKSKIKVAILGLSYKENSRDVRNSKVIDVIKELLDYGIETYVVDPIADIENLQKNMDFNLCTMDQLKDMSLVALMVPHNYFLNIPLSTYISMYDDRNNDKLFFDIKGSMSRKDIEQLGLKYWSL